MIPELGRSVYDQAQLSGAAAGVGLAGIYYIEPERWQLIAIPTRFGYWSVATGDTLIDTFTDADATELSTHTSDSGHSWSKIGVDDVDISLISGNGFARNVNTDGVADFYLSSATLAADMTAIIAMSKVGAPPISSYLQYKFRYIDASNYIQATFRWNGATIQLNITEFVAGSPVALIGYTNITTFASPPNSTAFTFAFNGTTLTISVGGSVWDSTTVTNITGTGLLIGPSTGLVIDSINITPEAGLVTDGVTIAKVKNYVIDQLEYRYGAGVVEVCNAYFGDEDSFRSYVPGVTPDDNPGNFPLAWEDPPASGNFEYTAFWLKSLHPTEMQLEWEADI